MENSVLIAIFDGWKKDESFKDNVYRKGNRIELDSTFKYHKSWDWLMPVIDKINNLGYSYRIDYTGTNISMLNSDFEVVSIANKIVNTQEKADNRIIVTYLAVVEFIKWYNKN